MHQVGKKKKKLSYKSLCRDYTNIPGTHYSIHNQPLAQSDHKELQKLFNLISADHKYHKNPTHYYLSSKQHHDKY